MRGAVRERGCGVSRAEAAEALLAGAAAAEELVGSGADLLVRRRGVPVATRNGLRAPRWARMPEATRPARKRPARGGCAGRRSRGAPHPAAAPAAAIPPKKERS